MLQRALDSPWLVRTELRRLATLPVTRLRFAAHGIRWGQGWRILGMPVVQRHRGSTIALGDGLVLRSWPRSNPLAPNHPVVLATRTAGARIEVGQGCGFTGTTLVAATRIAIGDRVQAGANATIVDTDFHPLTPEGRRADMAAGATRPVVIEDDVFIGMNSLVLKGVRLGAGCVVGAGSVVARDVPPRTVVAGNPARPVRTLP